MSKQSKVKRYIQPTAESGKQFYQDFKGKGPVVMLNLLKFKEKADYSDFEDLKPDQEITGADAYKVYMKCSLPHIKAAGSRVLFYGTSGSYLIGTESEQWDVVLLVEHVSMEKFMEFAQNPDYLKTAGHRNAALEDSRLLPISQIA